MTKHQDPAAIEAQPGTEIALLPPAQRALVVLKSVEAEKALKELVERTKPITAPVDKAGREEVHRAAMDHKNARLAITNAGKAAREDANAYSKAVVAEAARLVAINADEEARLFELRDTYDTAEQARKEEEERKERERVAAIRQRIATIKNLPVDSTADNAETLDATLTDLRAYEITFEDFAEFQDEANQARNESIETLDRMLATARAHEAAEAATREAEAKLAAQREELERQQAEFKRQQEEFERQKAELEAKQAAATAEPKPEGQKFVTAEPMDPNSWPEILPADDNPQWTPEQQAKVAAGGVAPMQINRIGKPIDEQPEVQPFIGVDLASGPDTTAERVMQVEPEERSDVPMSPELAARFGASAALGIEAPAEPELRMDAYYYGFEHTGERSVDMILSAIADAGHSYHHTDQWTEETEACEPHTGATPVEWIQNAAQAAADEITALRTRVAWLECLEAAGVDNWQGIDEALRIRREGGA